MKRNIKFIQITLANGSHFIFNAVSIVSVSSGSKPHLVKINFTNNHWVEYETHLTVNEFVEEILKSINEPTEFYRAYKSAAQLIKRGLKCINQIITKSRRYLLKTFR